MSTLEQRLGRSEHRQVDQMREWTLAIPAAFDETYQDFGVGALYGSHRSHGALGRFLDAVRAGDLPPKGRALGIESFDRLTREHSWDADTLLHEIIDSGITVVIESLGFLVLTRERMLREPHLQHLIIAEMTRAHAESERKQGMSLDNRAAERREARTMKRPVTSRSPPWLTLPRQEGTRAERAQLRASRIWVVIEDRKQVVILIFEMAADGFSASDVANHLNATGVETFTGTPLWKRHQVQWILKNEAVLGVYVPGHYVEDRSRKKGRRRVRDNSGRVEGFYPAIIDEDLWKRARRVVDGHAQSGRGRKGSEVSNLVKGLGYCNVCGSHVHLSGGYLRCSLSIQRQACSNNIGFPYAPLEDMLLRTGELCQAVVDLVPQTSRPDTAQQNVAELEAEIARKSDSMVQMVRDYAGKTGAQAEAAMAVQDELNADIARLKSRLDEAREQLGRDGPAERKGWLARVKAERALLESDDPKIRRDARVRISQEFHRLIQGFILHPGKQRDPARFVTVHLTPDAKGTRMSYVYTPETLVGMHFILSDGQTGLIGPSVLNQIPGMIEVPDNADDLSHSELVKRSRVGNFNYKITHDGNGNYQAVAAE
jgi:hypothetical protein